MPGDKNATLNETNYREWAQKVIDKYDQKNMLVDAMIWAQIIGFYEKALRDAGR